MCAANRLRAVCSQDRLDASTMLYLQAKQHSSGCRVHQRSACNAERVFTCRSLGLQLSAGGTAQEFAMDGTGVMVAVTALLQAELLSRQLSWLLFASMLRCKFGRKQHCMQTSKLLPTRRYAHRSLSELFATVLKSAGSAVFHLHTHSPIMPGPFSIHCTYTYASGSSREHLTLLFYTVCIGCMGQPSRNLHASVQSPSA